MKRNSGFTILELAVAMGIVSVISLGAVWLLFGSLSLRDQSLATGQAEEAVRTFNRLFELAGRNAKTVASGGNTLFTTATSDCWSLVWNPVDLSLRFTHLTTANCVADPSPVTSFLNLGSKAENFSFSIKPLATGGRELSATGTFHVIRPFGEYSQSFNTTVINLVD
jgi:prepilin-type N-terminal cleavage/methylation domain-containing protein